MALTRPQSMGAFPLCQGDSQLHGDYIAEATSLRENDRTPVQADYDNEIFQRAALRQRLPILHRERAKSL